MTVEGWVNPTTVGSGFQTLLVKERPGDLVYGLYSNTDPNRPAVAGDGERHRTSAATARRAAPGRHLDAPRGHVRRDDPAAATSTARRSSQLAVTGSIMTSTSPLKIGGNSIWGEWFNGLIDEVRVYNRALSAAEIQTDMNTAITRPTRRRRARRARSTATGGLGQVSLRWGAGDGQRRRRPLQRPPLDDAPASRRATANRIAQPTRHELHRHRARRRDDVLLQGHRRGRAPATSGPPATRRARTPTADTTPPTAPAGLGGDRRRRARSR